MGMNPRTVRASVVLLWLYLQDEIWGWPGKEATYGGYFCIIREHWLIVLIVVTACTFNISDY